jgi:ribonuclease HI
MKKIDVYTDGSSLGNPGPGGYGAVMVEGDKIVYELGGYEKATTNNRMELKGVIETLRYLSSLKSYPEVNICADSAYVLGGVNSWVANWERNGWRTANKKPVLNQDLWQELIGLVRGYKGNLSWEKVKGHSGHIYNERADQIATSFSKTGSCELVKL